MASLKRFFIALSGLLLMLVVSACGSSTTTATTTVAQSTPAPTISSTSSTIRTAPATVDSKPITILTDAKGYTLYYFTPDAPTKLACIAACAKAWPPLVVTGSNMPTSATTLPGTLSVLAGANGNQVEYSGYLLYTFVKDKAPGQITGQGVGGKWFVATPDLASYVIRTETGTIGGNKEAILTDTKGFTLYYFTPDTATKLACAGGCAKAWPPLLSTTSGTPLSEATISGTLSVLNDANGNQVEYNGHLLYTYIKDKEAGQITGQGVGGKWFVATPKLAA